MTLLYHFGGQSFDKNRRCLPLNTDHKPGGLWLTEDRLDGWKNLVLKQIQKRPSEWCYGDLRFVTIFEIDSTIADSTVLTIARNGDMDDFLERYLEKSQRNCRGEDLDGIRNQCGPTCSGSCFNCFGFHIGWDRVKVDYAGIALTFYSKEISHRSQDPRMHWSRLDCASWCIWDTRSLMPVRENVRTEFTCNGKCLSSHCPMK